MKRGLVILLTLSLSLLCIASCKKEEKPKHIVMTYVSAPLNVPSIIEKKLGFYSKFLANAGVESLSYSNITSGAMQTQALASGDIHFLNAVGATSVILSAAAGSDVGIISMYSRSPGAFVLFSKNNDIKKPEDLRGKKVAGPKGTILHELLVAYLKKGNLKEADVEFINMGIPEAYAAIENGSVDCALLAGPTAYNAMKKFNTVTSGKGLVDGTIVCATSKKFFKENKDIVQNFLIGQKQLLGQIDKNKEDAIAAVAKALNLTKEDVRAMMTYYDFDMTIRESDIRSIDNTIKFMYDNGMIDKMINARDLILK